MEDVNINEMTEEEAVRALNDYMQHANDFTEGFTTQMFNDGIIKDVTAKDLLKYFANPEANQSDLEKLAYYYYISNGEIFQLFDITKILPSLNYKLTVDDKSSRYETYLNKLNKALKKVRHKTLTRDMISQTISSGTLTGVWLGSAKKPYLFIFENLDYAFPALRRNGDWVVWVDMEWFDKMNEVQRESFFETLSPYVTKKDYEQYKKDPTNLKYVELPQERSICLRTHTLSRNQRLGIPWHTQSLYDILHKKKLKDLEKAIANKVINSVAVLKLGNKEYDDAKIKNKKKKVYGGVKRALDKNQADGITVVGIPWWSELDFPTIKTDGLDPKKFESINEDIDQATGGISTMVNGKGNFSSGKLNLDIIHKRIGVLLEDIEQEVYQKLFNIILPSKESHNYTLEYDKSSPLTSKEKVDILMKLHSQEGFSLKAVIDQLDGIDWNNYIEQSVYEHEDLELPEKIKPYASAYIGNQDPGTPAIENPENPNTDASKSSGGNQNPNT